MSMAEIALGTVENRNQAYDRYKDELQTSLTAYYGKTNRTEPAVCEAVVRSSADKAGELLSELDFEPWEVLPGYRCFALDGNHLCKIQKRLKETPGLYAEHAQEEVKQMSQHRVALDTVVPMPGMLTAIHEQEWATLTPRDLCGVASFLRTISRRVDVRRYRKSVRGPKKPPLQRKRCRAGTHVSTHKLLQQRG